MGEGRRERGRRNDKRGSGKERGEGERELDYLFNLFPYCRESFGDVFSCPSDSDKSVKHNNNHKKRKTNHLVPLCTITVHQQGLKKAIKQE